ncbi:MAG: DUF4352 domain-containing protein, partial [Erysipelotrichales bacterium]
SANSKSDGSDSTSFFLNKINPGVSMSGKVVFDVPSSLAKSKNTKLQVQTGAWGTEKELINLYK